MAQLWLSTELRDHVKRDFRGAKLVFRKGLVKDRDWTHTEGDTRYEVKGGFAVLDLWELPSHELQLAREWAMTNRGRYLEADGS